MQITTNGIALEVETHGPEAGPALILVRGLGSQLIHWPAALTDALAGAGYRVICFDNRDVGLSQRCPAEGVTGDAGDILAAVAAGRPPRPAYTLADMAGDVTGLMDALGIGRAHVLGISMGGAITQLLAIGHADRLLSATVVMTACRALGGPGAGAAQLDSLLAREMDEAAYIDAWVEEHATNGSPGYPMPEPDIRAEAALAWSRGYDPAGINRQFLATAAQPPRCEALRDVTLPCLVIHGAEDALIPPQAGREIAANIPGAAYHEIPGMGHIITPALAPLFAEKVIGFLADHGGASSSQL